LKAWERKARRKKKKLKEQLEMEHQVRKSTVVASEKKRRPCVEEKRIDSLS